MAWTSPATSTTTIVGGSGQTDLAIVGTAPVATASPGVVQDIYAGKTTAASSARIDMDTGALTIPNLTTTSGSAPQIYIKSSNTNNQIIMGDAALSPNTCVIAANGLLGLEASTNVEIEYGIAGAVGSKCGFHYNSAEVMRVDDEGYIFPKRLS